MLLFNQSNHNESPSRVFIHISACCLLPSPYKNQLPVNTRVSGHRSTKGTSPSSLSTNRYETYWYASQMESDRKSWISQGCRVIALGLDEAQQLVYAHPSPPKTLHLIFLYHTLIWNMEMGSTGCAVDTSCQFVWHDKGLSMSLSFNTVQRYTCCMIIVFLMTKFSQQHSFIQI